MRPGRSEVILLLLVLLLAGTLRVAGIGRQSLWFDEVATVRIAKQDLPQMMSSIRRDERIPPLHYVILHPWVRVFGDAEWSVRLPSTIASTAAVGMLYVLVRRLFGPAEGLVAAALLAVSPYQLVYAQEARSYALMALLAIASCDALVRLLERRTTWREAWYVVLAALLLYCHLYGVFVLMAHHVAYGVALVRARSKRESLPLPLRRWVMLNVAVLALFSPWIPIAIEWTRSVGTSFWVAPLTPDDISGAYHVYLGSGLMLLTTAALVIVGVAAVARRRPVAVALLLGLGLLPVVLPVVASMLSKPMFYHRYGIAAPAGVLALAACGVVAMRHRVAQVGATIALVVLSLSGTASTFVKADARGLAAYLEQNMRPGDFAAVTPSLLSYVYDHYVDRPDVRRKRFDGEAIPLTLPLEEGVHVWLIYDPGADNARPIIERGNWRVISHRWFQGYGVLELDDQPTDASVPDEP